MPPGPTAGSAVPGPVGPCCVCVSVSVYVCVYVCGVLMVGQKCFSVNWRGFINHVCGVRGTSHKYESLIANHAQLIANHAQTTNTKKHEAGGSQALHMCVVRLYDKY